MYPSAQTANSGAAVQRGNGGATSAIPKDAIERSTVQHALDEQERILTQLHAAISDVENRLTSVLGPTSPTPIAGGNPPIPSTVMARINQHNQIAIGAMHRLGDLMSRLEL